MQSIILFRIRHALKLSITVMKIRKVLDPHKTFKILLVTIVFHRYYHPTERLIKFYVDVRMKLRACQIYLCKINAMKRYCRALKFAHLRKTHLFEGGFKL